MDVSDAYSGHSSGTSSDGASRRRPICDVRRQRPVSPRHQPKQPFEKIERNSRAGCNSCATKKEFCRKLWMRLIDNSIRHGNATVAAGSLIQQRALKSLPTTSKASAEFSARNLLGKRVDYSGRSVIVVGPELQTGPMRISETHGARTFQTVRHFTNF